MLGLLVRQCAIANLTGTIRYKMQTDMADNLRMADMLHARGAFSW